MTSSPTDTSDAAERRVPEGRTPQVGGLPMIVVERKHVPAKPTPLAAIGNVLWRVRYLPLLMGLVMLGGIIGLYFQPPGLKLVFNWFKLTPGGGTSTPIAVPAPKQPAIDLAAQPAVVVGLGKLAPAGDVIVIAPPFGAGDARVAALRVSEGERVTAGQLLAVLDSEATFQSAIETARATVAAREAQVAQTLAAVRASREEAQAALQRAEATARNAQLDFERIEALFKRGVSAEAAFQQKRTQRDEAAREVEKAKATLSRWTAVEPDQHPDVILAARNLDTARAELARATQELEKAHVAAPVDGTVLTIHVRPGEKPGAKGILNLGNLDKMTAEVEVYQSRIGAVAIGDAVEVTAEALPGKLKGHVTRIGLEVGRQVLTEANPAANTDARVVKVYVALEPESSKVAQRFTNLQVTARIAVKSRS